MKNQKVIITIGLQASGKTTWAKEQVDQGQGKIINICKDDLRAMIHNFKSSSGREDFILEIRDQIIYKSLEEGKTVIVSDTNLNPKHEQAIRDLVLRYNKAYNKNILFEIKDFRNVPLNICIERDQKRSNSVGAKVIQRTYWQYRNQFPQKEIIQKDPTLNNAIICDLDGTLAILKDRTPFQFQKCESDLINESILDLLIKYKSTHKIILLTGREDICKEHTIRWLKKYAVPYDELYMRKEKDYRKDYIVKKEIFEQNIKGKYNIDFILEDKEKVVKMWRELKLLCFQVDNDFSA